MNTFVQRLENFTDGCLPSSTQPDRTLVEKIDSFSTFRLILIQGHFLYDSDEMGLEYFDLMMLMIMVMKEAEELVSNLYCLCLRSSLTSMRVASKYQNKHFP